MAHIIEGICADLAALAAEAKKKSPALKMKAEGAMIRIRNASVTQADDIPAAIANARDILQAFIVACEETKLPKAVSISIAAIHRLIQNNAVHVESFPVLISTLQRLTSSGLEEIKVLQCISSLVTTTPHLIDKDLAEAFVLCFSLHFSRDPTTAAIAAATLRQITTAVFDRVVAEDAARDQGSAVATTHASDGFMLFQDFCLLTSGEAPHWLHGLSEMTRMLGLELIESALSSHPHIFHQHEPYAALVKQRVCALIIKLFSPTISATGRASAPVFPVTARLLRVVHILIATYNDLLGPESEIFLSMLAKFLYADKLLWHRVLSLEVLHEIFRAPAVLTSFFKSPEMHAQSVDIFNDLTAQINYFIIETEAAHDTAPTHLPIPQPPLLLSLMDRTEAPQVAPGYILALCFSSLVVLTKSLSSLVQPLSSRREHRSLSGSSEAEDVFSPRAEGGATNHHATTPFSPLTTSAVDPACQRAKMVFDCVWNPLLSGFTQLLSKCTNEHMLETILRAIQSAVRICGTLNLRHQREAFLTALCTACLPSNYSWTADVPSQGWQITNKNLNAVHILLNSALCMGNMMGSGWDLIISTIQQVVAVLDLDADVDSQRTSKHIRKPSLTTAASKRTHRRTSSGTALSVNTTSTSELPALGAMLAQLFQVTHTLDDEALNHLMTALWRQSENTLEKVSVAGVNHVIFRHDAFAFPVMKLLQVGLANLDRMMIFWPMVTAHLIEVSCHAHAGLRQQGVIALTRLIHGALSYPRQPPIQDNPGLQQAVLSPLRNLASCPHLQTRRQQLECVMQVLDSSGQSLAHAWPVVIGIISDTVAGNTRVTDATIITLAFENLQLIVQDFLPALPVRCMLLLLRTIGSFCHQHIAVNVALTAVGLLWNIADHVSQNRVLLQERLEVRLKEDSVSTEASTTASSLRRDIDSDGLPRHVSISGIWRLIYEQLATLCLDARADIRRSAIQTLYPMLKTHAHLLEQEELKRVMEDIILNTLRCIITGDFHSHEQQQEIKSGDAMQELPDASNQSPERGSRSSSQPPQQTVTLVSGVEAHHSTSDDKLWAETKALSVAGIVQVYVSCLELLQACNNFPGLWQKLLDLIVLLVQDSDDTVSFAAAASLQSLIRAVDQVDFSLKPALQGAFVTWLSVCQTLPQRQQAHRTKTLVALTSCMIPALGNLRPSLSDADVSATTGCFYMLMSYQPSDALYLTRPSDVQEQVLACLLLLVPSVQFPHPDIHLVATVLQELIRYVELVNTPPWLLRGRNCFVGVSVASIKAFVTQFCGYSEEASVIRAGVACSFLRTLTPIADARYAGPNVALWEAAMEAIVVIIDYGLRGLAASLQQTDSAIRVVADELWTQIVRVIDAALFPSDPGAHNKPDGIDIATVAGHEDLDIAVVQVVSEAILPNTSATSCRGSSRAGVDVAVPAGILEEITALLRRGSVNMLQSANIAATSNGQPSPGLTGEVQRDNADTSVLSRYSNLTPAITRRAFAKACFQALVDCSNGSDALLSSTPSDWLGVEAMADECGHVLQKHLPAISTDTLTDEAAEEVMFVVTASASLINSRHRSLAKKLYPLLVDSAASTRPDVARAVRQVLKAYQVLI
eukprot:m.33096 g.33096  ORF g.33096 m.33096 type:complete len:1605 (-) comp10854_c0_seq2:417-5231(-)